MWVGSRPYPSPLLLMHLMQSVHTKPALPFLESEYLAQRVDLDEIGDLTDQQLNLLLTEVTGLYGDATESIKKAVLRNHNFRTAETLSRVSRRFHQAIKQEQALRADSVLDQLKAVTSERDALRFQLSLVAE